jgi:hypothetical protein
VHVTDETPDEDGEAASAAKRAKNPLQKHKKKIIYGGAVTVLAIVAAVLLAKRQTVGGGAHEIDAWRTDLPGTAYGDIAPHDDDRADCAHCGRGFDVAEARDEYESTFRGEMEYDYHYHGEVCAGCAVSDSESKIDHGRAIFMVNGDEDYDDDFVQRYL